MTAEPEEDRTGRTLMVIVLIAGAVLLLVCLVAATFFVRQAMENVADRDAHATGHDSPSVRCAWFSL